MSQLGQSRRLERRPVTSGLPRLTDVIRPGRLVRFVPIGDIASLVRNERSRQLRRPYFLGFKRPSLIS
jgi:hypothetical protein